MYAEFNERVEAATSSYSATGNFLQYIYSMFVAKNDQKFEQSVSFMNFPSQFFCNDINHGYRAITVVVASDVEIWSETGGST